jgi:pimeloyl-ACP methyl ester carboxylesterase
LQLKANSGSKGNLSRPADAMNIHLGLSRRIFFFVGGAVLALSGCSVHFTPPDLAGVYSEVAQLNDLERNPVIVIPGILGSKLRDPETGTLVWGAFAGGAASPADPEGLRLLALPMEEGAPLSELRDGVVPDGALDQIRISLLGLRIELNAYINILQTLGAGGYRDTQLAAGGLDYGDAHFTCFQFDYDWRRDIVDSARELHEYILARRRYVKEEVLERFGVADYEFKFDVVAHSMGGLVLRYYLRYGPADLPAGGSLPELTWAGARYVDRAILIGTPNAGSTSALIQLVEGAKFAPFISKYPPALLGTMPSIYQLLPRSRHGAVVDAAPPGSPIPDLLDPTLWRESGLGLADPDQASVLKELLPEVSDPSERLRIALDHQVKSLARARQFMAAMDRPANPPPGLSIQLVAGDAMDTPAVVALNRSGARLEVISQEPGDGTVLRSSALLDERVGREERGRLETPIAWERVTFLFRDHLGLTADPTFADNILFELLERPHAKLR